MSQPFSIKRLDYLEAMNDRFEMCNILDIREGRVDVARQVIAFCRTVLSVSGSMKLETEIYNKMIRLLNPWRDRADVLFEAAGQQAGRRNIVRKILYLAEKKDESLTKHGLSLMDKVKFLSFDVIKLKEKFFCCFKFWS